MTVVVKLGGSLLTLPGLAEKLRNILLMRSEHRCLIVIGGGATTDVVREWSRIHQLSEEVAHWLALASLDLNIELLQKLLPYDYVRTRKEAAAIWSASTSPLFLRVSDFAQAEEMAGGLLIPHDWSVTSDSMAAWITLRWPADELLMLKSVPAPGGMTIEEASRQQLVDDYFPRFADQIPHISWCNLRAPKLEIERWL